MSRLQPACAVIRTNHIYGTSLLELFPLLNIRFNLPDEFVSHLRVILASSPTWTGQWTLSIWYQIQGTMRFSTVSLWQLFPFYFSNYSPNLCMSPFNNWLLCAFSSGIPSVCKQVVSVETTRDIDWATYTCPLGFHVFGNRRLPAHILNP